jgi:rsbT co-antagonist protein RsbR
MNTDQTVDASQEILMLRETYGLSDADVDRIRTYGRGIVPKMDELVESFYNWLETQPAYAEFLSDPAVLARNKRLIREFWDDFFRCDLDHSYLTSRRRIGETHARIGLPPGTYLAGVNRFFMLVMDLYAGKLKDSERLEASASITRLIHMDTAIVIAMYAQMTNELLLAQSKSLMEMSTPVTQIWSGILLLPLVGVIDSKRAQDMMNSILAKIAESQARFFILDISGVAIIDTAVANHLIKITKATSLMGCKCTISGVSPAIAQTIVDLGIDVGEVDTTANMRDALAGSFDSLGLKLHGEK